MRRRTLVLAAVPALLAAAVGWRALRPQEVTSARVVRGTSISAVYASGAVEPVDRVDVSARVSGPVEKLLVREGDVVKKDDVLAVIDAPTLGHDVTRAQADSTAAAARLSGAASVESLRAQRQALAAQLNQAKDEKARIEALFKSGSTSSAELERARAQVDSLAAQVAATEAQERDLRIALQADATRQRAVFDAARSRLSDTEIRSPLDGTVLSRRVEVGQVVGVNQVILRVGDLSRLHLEVDVDEADVGRVRVGQAAAVRLYARPGEVLDGHVAKIRPEADRERKSFRVEVDFDGKVESLYPGMTAEVNIVLARHERVTLAPVEALHGDRLWVVVDGRVRFVPVVIKQRDLTLAEVEGVEEGAEIIVGDAPELEEGARVRTVPSRAPVAPAAASSGALSVHP